MLRLQKPTHKAKLRASHRLGVESLEQRRLLSINAAFANNVLTVSTPNNDSIVIAAEAGIVRVNGSVTTPQVSASSVQQIVVTGGSSTPLIDLSAVNSASFTAMQSTTISFASSPQTAVVVKGSQFADTLNVTGTSSADTLSLSLEAVASSGISVLNVETTSVLTLDGDDTTTVTLSPTGGTLSSKVVINDGPGSPSDSDSVTILGSAAADTFVLSLENTWPTGVSVFDVEIVTVDADGGADSFELQTNNAGDDNININGSLVSAPWSNVSYASVEAITVHSHYGHDLFTVSLVDSGPALPNLNLLAFGTTGSEDSVSIVGTENDDTLSISSNVINANGAQASLVGIESVTLDGRAGNDVLTASSVSVPLTLLGDAGRDQIALSQPGAVAVTINAGADSDSITLKSFMAATSLNVIGNPTSPTVDDRLDLSRNNLTGIGPLTVSNVGAVDVSHNSLAALPTALSGAKYIDIGYNSMTSLSASASFAVETLDARYNNLTTVGTLSNFNKLATLFVYGNDGSLDLMPFAAQAIDIDLASQDLERAETISPLDWRNTTYKAAVEAGIAKIAEALHYSPIKIFEYVRNEFKYEPYAGVMKGPIATLATRAGNDWDQAGLLIALLQAAGVQASQTRFNFGQVSISDEMLQEWLGTGSVEAAETILSSAGVLVSINPTVVVHAWAEVQLVVPGQGLQWIRLDPSWKFHERRPFFDFIAGGDVESILGVVPFDETAYLALPNPQDPTTLRLELPYEYYEQNVATALLNNPQWRHLSTADLKVDGPIIAQHFAALPGLPLQDYSLTSAVQTYNDYAAVPSQYFHRFVLETSIDSNPTDDLLTPGTFRTMDVAYSPISVNFVPAGSGMMRGELRFGGNLVEQSDPVPSAGHKVTYSISRLGSIPIFNTTQSYVRDADPDQVLTVGVGANQVTEGYVAYLQSLAEEMSFDTQAHSSQDLGSYLGFVISDFFYKQDSARDVVNSLTYGMPIYNVPQLGVTTASNAPSGYRTFPTHQVTVVPDELRIDVKDGIAQSWSRHRSIVNDPEEALRDKVLEYSGSAQEHATLEELINIESMSTVRVFQKATAAGQAFHEYGPGANPTTIRNTLQLSTAAEDAIVAAVAGGGTVKVHTSPISIYDPANPTTPMWTGAAWTNFSSDAHAFSLHDGILTGGGAATNIALPFNILPSSPRNFIAGDPVNVANGAVFEDVVDVQFPGVGIPINFQRHYDSSNTETSVALQAGFGVGWTHSYSDYLDVAGLSRADYAQHGIDRIVPGGQAVWVDSKGQRHEFTVGGFNADHSQTWTNADGLHGHFREYLGGAGGFFHVYEFIETSGVVRRFVQTNWDLDKRVRLYELVDCEQSSNPNQTHLRLAYWSGDNFGRRLEWVWNDQHPESKLQIIWTGSDDTARISQIRQVTNAGTVLRTWDYSHTSGRLTKVEAPSVPVVTGLPATMRPTIQYEYETGFAGTKVNGLLRKIIQPDGGVVEHTYHPNGRGFQVIDPEGFAQTFEFDLFRGQTRFYDEKGRLTVYDYDDDTGNLELTVNPDRAREVYTWNADSYQLSKTDAYGLTEKYTYGTGLNAVLGNIATVEVGFDLTTGWQPATVQEANTSGTMINVPLVTSYTYDTRTLPFNGLAFSKVSSVTLPSAITGARLTSYTYSQRGDMLTQTETIKVGETRTTSHVYDSYGQLLRTVDPRGDQQNPSTTTAYVTKYENYNTLGQATQISRWIETVGGSPVWAVENFHYNAEGFLDWQEDANDFKTEYIVDDLGRRLKTIHPQPDKALAWNTNRPETVSIYDAMGNLVELRQPVGSSTPDHVTKYAYDKRQRLVTTTLADGSIMTNAYDGTGAMAFTTDGRGQATNFFHDMRDRAVETMRDDGSSSFATFNARGTPVLERDANRNEISLEYNDLGRLKRQALPYVDFFGNGTYPVWEYAYDAVGNRTSETLGYKTLGGSLVVDRRTSYSFDSLNRLIKRIDPDPDLILTPAQNGPEQSPVWTYQYDKANNLTSTQLRPANVSDASPATQKTDATFDGLNRRRTESKFISAVAGDAVRTFTYDAVGNRLTAKDPRDAVTVDEYDRWNRLVQQTDPDPDTSSAQIKKPIHAFTYDQVGNLLIETLREEGDSAANHDRKMVYTYDAMNRPLSDQHYEKEGSAMVLAQSFTEYDAAGNVLAQTDPLGRTTRHEYDSLNRRIRTFDTLGAKSTASYDAVGNRTVLVDARGNVTVYEYDSLNRLVKTNWPDPDAGGSLQPPVTTNVYNFAGDPVITYLGTDLQPFDRRVDYVYDQLHRVIEMDEAVPAAGEAQRHVWKYGYDVAGNRVTMTDPANLVTTYSYDGLNRRLTETDPDPDGAGSGTSRTWGYAYDKNGNLIEERLDAPLQFLWRTQYVYDFLNRQTEQRRINVSTAAVYSTSSTDYDVVGNVVLTTDPEARQTQFAYDGLDRVVDEQVLGAGSDLPHTTSTYDASGNLLTSTIVMASASDNRTTTYGYDALNRLLLTTDSLRHVTANRYDAVRNLTAQIDALGHSTSYVYDNLDRRTEVRDPLNHVTVTAYDEANNVTRVTDPNNNVTTYQYDGMDRLRKEIQGTIAGTHPTTTYTYDLRDHLDTVVDRRGWKRDFDYDAFGRLLTEKWEDPNQPGTYLKTLAFSYTADDQLNTASGGSGGGNYYYTYSDHLRRLSKQQFNDSLSLVTTDYTYNLADQVTRLDVTNDASGGVDHAYYQTRSYDAAGRLDILQRSGLAANDNHQQADFDWNAAGQLKVLQRKMVLAPGVQGTQPAGGVGDIFDYDLAGRLVRKTDFAPPTSALIFDYTFDAADRITSMTTSGATLPTTTSSYVYNNADELTGADHQATGLTDESYALDNAGNRTGGGHAYATAYNRLSNDGTYTYSYDAEGNLTTRSKSGEHVTYTWDHRNRLTKVDYRTAAGAATTFKAIEYLYDAFDRRIFKKVDNDGTGGTQGFAFTGFAYDGDELLLSHNGLGVLTHRYLEAEEVDYVLSDEPVGGAAQWAMVDHEGSVRRLVKDYGTIVADFAYDSFGKPAVGGTTPAAVDFLFGYAGGIYDGETGNQYHQARYYDSATGRFLSEDPAAADPHKNLYRYADGDPVNNTDPNGLSARGLGTSSLYFGGSLFGSAGASSTTGNPFFGSSISRAPAISAPSSFGSSVGSLNPFLGSGSAYLAAPSFNLVTTASAIASGNHSLATGGSALSSLSLQSPVDPFAGTSSIVNTDFNRPAVPPAWFQGTAQTAVGTAQLIGGTLFGAGTSWSGVGAVGGGLVALRGLDNINAGFQTVVSGQVQRTALNQAVTYATGSEGAGYGADAVADLGTAFVGAVPARPVSLAPATVSGSTRIVAQTSALESKSIAVGLEPRPIVSQFDSFTNARVGPYSHLPDPPNVGFGRPFSTSQRRTILQANRDAHEGQFVSDESGMSLVPGQRNVRGVTPPLNQAQVDHIIPRSKGGTNSYSNAQVLAREENMRKSNQ